MLLSLSVGYLMFLAVYGGACYWVASVLCRKAWRLKGMFLLLALCLLWVPAFLCCFALATLIPLTWGHAGELLVVSAIAGSVTVWIVILERFGAMLAEGDAG